jgi:hypothetical protein
MFRPYLGIIILCLSVHEVLIQIILNNNNKIFKSPGVSGYELELSSFV